VPLRTFWALRYRPPKTIAADIYLRLCAAYQAECERQMRKLRHELETTKAIAGLITLLWLRLRLWWTRRTSKGGHDGTTTVRAWMSTRTIR